MAARLDPVWLVSRTKQTAQTFECFSYQTFEAKLKKTKHHFPPAILPLCPHHDLPTRIPARHHRLSPVWSSESPAGQTPATPGRGSWVSGSGGGHLVGTPFARSKRGSGAGQAFTPSGHTTAPRAEGALGRGGEGGGGSVAGAAVTAGPGSGVRGPAAEWKDEWRCNEVGAGCWHNVGTVLAQ